MNRIGLLLVLCACASQRGEYGQNAAAGAVVMTAAAATASAINRSQGGCYANCTTGTVCNPKTGYCDVLPCRGLCRADQECDTRGLIEACVARRAPDLQLETTPAAPPKTELKTPQ